MTTSNRPVNEIRLGHVKAVIFANETDAGGVRYGINFEKIYRDGEKWASTRSFGRDDLPLVAKVADMAHTWIYAETQNGVSGPVAGSRDKRDSRSDS